MLSLVLECRVLVSAEPLQRVSNPVDRFEDLFRQLYPPLFGLSYRLLRNASQVEETLQEVFLKLIDAEILHRPDEEVASCLRQVCLNLSLNRLRSQRRADARPERVAQLAQVR